MTATPEVRPLDGFTVGVTAARRAEDLAILLRRRGAQVQHAPALRTVPLPDDGELLTATRHLIARPPDVVIATTAIGFRGWLETADGWDLGAALLERLRAARLLARGPKVKGAVRAAGLTEEWSPGSESMAEVRARLLADGVRGLRIALQLHGEPLPGLVADLWRAGAAEVLEVPVYRWLPPKDPEPLDRMIDTVLAGGLDAVTFTSAPAAVSLLERAGSRGRREELVEALRTRVLAACVGPVTAGPLRDEGVETVQPERFRLGPLVQLLCQELPGRSRPLRVAGRQLEIRGHAVVVDGELRTVPPAGMALLRTLARRPGRLVSHADLLRSLPGSGQDAHAVETAMARLRSTLGAPELIRTGAERGYRLEADPEAEVAPSQGAGPEREPSAPGR